MQTQSLSGPWRFRQSGTSEWLPATVPGTAHTDLLALGRIPDPFVGENEITTRWPGETDWEYARVFTPEPGLLEHDRVALVCDGLDTLAEVFLNDHRVGSAANMLHAQRWEVKDRLRSGSNELRIRFTAPIPYARARDLERHLLDTDQTLPGGQYLRKAPCHFGWDWGPKLPSVGIWQAVRLEAHSTARLRDVHLRQQHTAACVTLTARAWLEAWGGAPLQVRLRLTAPDGVTQTVTGAPQDELRLEVADPQLWWPNGLGAQPLYQVQVELLANGARVDERRFRVGLRTLELRQAPDEWGRAFMFVVNGVPLFAKGSNWIPADSFPPRLTPAQREHLLRSAAQAHHNMIRIWGGGYYEVEHFYDLCDELGLLVWQDFMFSCGIYPLGDPAFLANVQVEVTETVRRLRHRACLALWCGNNEMEAGWVGWGWSRPDTQDLKAADQQFFYSTLRAWVAAEDPDHDYWPSSPSSHTPHEAPQSTAVGDSHLWEVWHALQPIRFYRAQFPRFASEFGFQSLPGLATIASYAPPAEWNMTSHVMEHHQRSPEGNGRIIAYLTRHYRLPRDFPALVYLTQVLQAEAMRIGVEHWRRTWPRCAGALYWQLNDCWPVASWSSIDYFGRWKALHYASRRFFAPLLLSLEDDGDRMGIFISNDTTQLQAGEVRWSLETLRGEVLQAGSAPLSAAPLAVTPVARLDFGGRLSGDERRGVLLAAELWQAGACAQRALATFAPDKHVNFTDPGLEVEAGLVEAGLSFSVRTRAAARFVELQLDGADVIFSDNYFDLPAGRQLTVTCPLPAGWSLEQARAALRLRSLYDSY